MKLENEAILFIRNKHILRSSLVEMHDALMALDEDFVPRFVHPSVCRKIFSAIGTPERREKNRLLCSVPAKAYVDRVALFQLTYGRTTT
jgi:hypothetical protein